MDDEKKAPEGHDQAECPKCKHKFWHKVSDGFKKVGADALDVAANILQPGVPR